VSFAKTVAAILKKCPGSLFLFTGRTISKVFENILIEANVANQALFVGWVDTDFYANLIDCFLESFPFGCGVTGMQALLHGTVVNSLWDKDTLPTFYFENPNEANSFHPNWIISTSPEQYINSAVESFHRWQMFETRSLIIPGSIYALESDKFERFLNLIKEDN
jgi:hypothetical protein